MVGDWTCFSDEVDQITSVSCLGAECIFESQHEPKPVDYYCMSSESGHFEEMVNRLRAIVPSGLYYFEEHQDNVDNYHPNGKGYLYEAVLILEPFLFDPDKCYAFVKSWIF